MAGRADKTNFTIAWLKSLKPSAARVTHWDSQVPNFGVRVSDRGKLTFLVTRRPRGSKELVNHIIGEFHPETLSLATARERAREAIAILDSGKRPKDVEADRAREEAQNRADTFGVLATQFCEKMSAGQIDKLRGTGPLRGAREMVQNIERVLMPAWRDKPIKDIRKRDVMALLDSIKKPLARRHALASVRRVFDWLDDREIVDNPCTTIRGRKVHGAVLSRDRVLDDDEIKRVWLAAGDFGYPYGDIIRMLLLTGQRLSEISDARWSEISGGLLNIPGTRMKANRDHVVPLCPKAQALLDGLPRFNGDFIFSTTAGARSFSGFSKAKKKLDAMIGDIKPWRLHDLRRTVRTRLGSAGVPTVVAELVISHTQKGVVGTYDRYEYLAERRQALAQWEAKLTSIITPPPANVVPMVKSA